MKRLSYVLALSISVATVSAQDYYSGRDTVSADGITFSVKKAQGIAFSLANVCNTLADLPQVYKDGREIEPEFEEYAYAESIDGTIEKAFTETFTREEYEKLRQDPEAGIVIYYTYSSEGLTQEVYFVCDDKPCLLAIAPAKFALLEKNLKKYAKWKVNAFGQKLKFMHGMSFANFSKTNLRYDDPGLTLPDIPRPDPGSLEDEVLVTPDWH